MRVKIKAVSAFLTSVMALGCLLLIQNLREQCTDSAMNLREQCTDSAMMSVKLGMAGSDRSQDKRTLLTRTNVTLVSAFFDIGNYQKGIEYRTGRDYHSWCKVFGRIHTSLVFYTDSEEFAQTLSMVRSRLDPALTHIIRVNRSTLWAFELRGAIAQLYSRKDYPKHQPNTVVPEYSCAMHAKYACLKDAILTQPPLVTSEFVAWIDIGYFRDLENSTKEYRIVLLEDFDEKKVLFNQVECPNFKLLPSDIFSKNLYWVGGGLFIAARDVMLRFCDEYERAVRYFLFQHQLSSTDQQTLYAALTHEGRRQVRLALYIEVLPSVHDWFDLGLAVLRELNS